MTDKFMIKREKIRAQMKSRIYYMFWGAATVAVVSGQLYVGTSYRTMSRSLDRWFEETIDIMQTPLKRKMQREGFYERIVIPQPENYGMTIIK